MKKSTDSKINLSIKDFTYYFEKGRLGCLWFPNGECDNDEEDSQFHIDLAQLYKCIFREKIRSKTEVPSNSIVDVIAFGDTVAYPYYRNEKVKITRPKYIFFGKDITFYRWQEKDRIKYADFLVITKKDLNIKGRIIEPEFVHYMDVGDLIETGGIRLNHKSFNQVVDEVKENYGNSTQTINSGVSILSNNNLTRFEDLTKIKNKNPRKVYWDENINGYLIGRIA